jgi:hypothetical protein
LNERGQFSIIAALLVAIVLIGTVIATYSAIRSNTIREQPPIQSAIDETNLAVKQILGFTVGYYGSVLKSTGNSTYARELATDYLHSGLVYTVNMHPEWGTSFDVTNSKLSTYWYMNTSDSSGSLSVSYNLTGLGISGITYDASCSLGVQVMPTVNNQAQLNISKDGTEPLVNLGKSNFNFYRFDPVISKWIEVNPPNEPLALSNGTYQIDIPAGIDVNSYLIQVEDQRGIMVLASSYSSYSINFAWNVTMPTTQQYVDSNSSDVDLFPNRGTDSNFTAMRFGPDATMDTLTEAITTAAVPEKSVNFSTDEGSDPWINRPNAYDNNIGTRAATTVPTNSWSNYLTLSRSNVSSHYLRYWVGRDDNKINGTVIQVYNGTWITVFADAPTTWDTDWNSVNFTEMSVSKVRFQFFNTHNSQVHNAYVYEIELLQSGSPQNCELDLEVQWTNLDLNNTSQWLCIYTGAMGSEDLRVDVRNGSSWKNLFTDLTSGQWNNVSVTQYIDSPIFTIRFKGATEILDPVQDSWQIDAALMSTLGVGNTSSSYTTVFELLQNGTIRWLGQDLQLAMQAKPIPPIPVRSIHVNQTASNVTREVPFQLEDWASNYRIPLGLTNNESVFSDRTMLVFLASSDVSRVTVWWNGSDTTVQTHYAYDNLYFKDNPLTGTLNNSRLLLRFDSEFIVNASTLNGSTSSATSYMRINNKLGFYGSGLSYVIVNGSIRDIVQQEAEFHNGIPNCPNVYAHIVLTLPANVPYYTYQLRLMFIQSQQDRTITELCPIKLTVSTGQPQTENGTSGGNPIVINTTDLFYNSSITSCMHHWSQFISGTKGAGIMFTDDANQRLYIFDNIAGRVTGALRVSNSPDPTIEFLPVTMASASFKYALDVTWHGAIATFDGAPPIYKEEGTAITGLWMTVEYLPTVTVTTEA